MGSRIGSIAILLVIAAIVVAVVVIISRLDLLSTGEPDAPVIVASIDDGELVLLNEPQSITVTISSGSPIATLELFVDDSKVADVIPPYSAERGAWIGSFVWTPERLGFANIRIVTLDEQGVESTREIQVEVTDDQARVAATLRVQVLGISPLQQFAVGSSIRLALSATGSQAIERFDMLVDDEHVVSVSPVLDPAGQYIAAIEWTPLQTGEFQVTISAIDVAGRQESETIPVIIVSQGGTDRADSAGENEAQQQDSTASSADPDQSTAGESGEARIESPSDGQQFTLDEDLSIDVDIMAQNTGPVASALLYITPVAPNGTLGSPKLIHSSSGQNSGAFSERVEDVESWIIGSGTYELELVVFTPEDERYDHRIRFHVVAGAREDGTDADPQSDTPAGDEIDLAIVTARQSSDDPRRLNVSITNASGVDIERINVIVTVANATTGAEIASADVTMGIEPGGLRTIPLDLNFAAGDEVDALVLLEATADTDASNNIFEVTLSPVPSPEQQEQAEQQQAAVEQPQQEAQEQEQEPPSEPGPAPDLSPLDVQATTDGYVLLSVLNSGDGPASSFTVVISDAAGNELETITRGDADANPLAPGAAEILAGSIPHSGVIRISVVAAPDDGERNLDNNSTSLEVP